MVTIRRARVLALGVTVGLTLVTAAPALAEPNPGGINGSAFGLSVELGGRSVIDPTPQVVLPRNGERQEISTIAVPLSPLVTADVLAAATEGDAAAGTSTATASVTMAEVLPSLIPGQASVLSADLISAQCDATTEGEPTGSASILNLRGNGVPRANATPGPNTNITVAGLAEVVLNEQIMNIDGSLTVNAVRVTLLPSLLGEPGAEIILASVTCGPNAIDPAVNAIPTAGLPIAAGIVAAFALGVVVMRRREMGPFAA